MHSFLVSVPLAIVLWALMLLGVAVAVALMGRPRRSAPAPFAASAPFRPAAPRGAATSFGAAVPLGRAASSFGAAVPLGRAAASFGGAASGAIADDLRFADEVAVAAGRAARARAGWEAAQEQLDAAWAAYEVADAAARRTWAATSFPQMSRRRKLGENADRERYLHHAATVACRQRELSIAQLNDVYAHRGWNPRLHPVAQEPLLRNAIRENKFGEYQKAQRRERVAWQQAEIASEALRELRAEAAAAFGRSVAEQPVADEFRWAEPWTTGELPAVA
jgi:hypothetical protein